MSTITLEEQAAPATPGANKVVLYPKADGLLYWKDDAGVERAVPVNPLAIEGVGKYIGGLIQSHNVLDATNDLDISVGSCMDDTGIYSMVLPAIIGKRSDAAWAVGGTAAVPVGGLDTGAVGNSDYFIWLIKRLDTGVVDVLFSLSATAPTMPANYTVKRLIGWFKRAAGTIVVHQCYEISGGGIDYQWIDPKVDIGLVNTLTTTERTDALSVPLAFSVVADILISGRDVAAPTGIITARVCNPFMSDWTPVYNQNMWVSQVSNQFVSTFMRVRTSSAGLIASKGSIATFDEFYVVTLGFSWSRR